MSSLSSVYYHAYHNLPLYVTFVPEYTSLIILPSTTLLAVLAKQRSDYQYPPKSVCEVPPSSVAKFCDRDSIKSPHAIVIVW